MDLGKKDKLLLDDFNHKKTILKVKKIKSNNECFPYIKPEKIYKNEDIYFYEINSLTLDYNKYFKYIPSQTKIVEFIFTPYSIFLEMILIVYGKEPNERIYELFNHNHSGFTFTLFHLIKQSNNRQPTFYFNFFQNYYETTDVKEKQKMIINEFIRISENYKTFDEITTIFFNKTNNNKEIFSLEHFYDLLEIIEGCLLIIKKKDIKNKYEKFNIVIDDFVLFYEDKYYSFKTKIWNKEKQFFYLIKFTYENKYNTQSQIIYKALDYFGESVDYYKFMHNFFYILSYDKMYIPRNVEKAKISCYAKFNQLEKIINIFGNNYVDLFKFKIEIDLYLKNIIDFNEMESLIINRYRQEYSCQFKNIFLLNIFVQTLSENNTSVKYKESLTGYLSDLLLIPYVSIDFNNKRISIMGPIYCKIINKIILEETNYNYIKYKQIYNNNISYGKAFENYIKLSLEYKTLGLYIKEKNKYFIYAKEVKDSKTINWNFINKKISLNDDNMIIIDQTKKNGAYLDFIIIKTKRINSETYCTLFFIQISVNKSIQQLKDILDNIYLVVDEYKKIIEANNMIYCNSFFYLISSEIINKNLFEYCFNNRLKINITFEENQKIFRYYKNSLIFNVEEIKELPIEQNCEDLINNYLQYQIFKIIPNIAFSNENLLLFSKYHNNITHFGFTFNTLFIIKNFGDDIKVKFLVELVYKSQYFLKNNILGICTIYEREKDEKSMEKKEEKSNVKDNNNKLNKKLLGKKTIRLIKKQIYWIKDSIVDDKGKALDKNTFSRYGSFHIFKITKLNKK